MYLIAHRKYSLANILMFMSLNDGAFRIWVLDYIKNRTKINKLWNHHLQKSLRQFINLIQILGRKSK